MTLDRAIRDLQGEYKSEYNQQLVEWLKCLAKISDMLDGTIDHLSGDDAKELLSDVKWELKLAKLTEL